MWGRSAAGRCRQIHVFHVRRVGGEILGRGWCGANGDGSAPAFAINLGEACADGAGDELAESDRHVVEGDHAAAVFGWG
jgi:hypothetical protein